MAVESGVVEIGFDRILYSGETAPRIVIGASYHRSIALEHLADAAQVIACVEVGRVASVLPLREGLQRDSVRCAALLALLHPASDKLDRRGSVGAVLFQHLDQAA